MFGLRDLYLIYLPPLWEAKALVRISGKMGMSSGTWVDGSSEEETLSEIQSRASEADPLVVVSNAFKYSVRRSVRHERFHEIAFIQHPAETLREFYLMVANSERARGIEPVPFQDWASKITNPLFSFYSKRTEILPHGTPVDQLERLKRRLDRFFFVGCMEGVERWAPVLWKSLGLKAEAGEATLSRESLREVFSARLPEVPTGLRTWIEQSSHLDMELYRHELHRQEERIAWLTERAEAMESGVLAA